MLTQKLRNYLIESGFYIDEPDSEYEEALKKLGIDLTSSIGEFNYNTTEITFKGRKFEIYNICWFSLNSDYELLMQQAWNGLQLPHSYIPLDGFEAEGGFFYNRQTDEVLELEAGSKLIDFQKGLLRPQWNTFNEFLEWYFEL